MFFFFALPQDVNKLHFYFGKSTPRKLKAIFLQPQTRKKSYKFLLLKKKLNANRRYGKWKSFSREKFIWIMKLEINWVKKRTVAILVWCRSLLNFYFFNNSSRKRQIRPIKNFVVSYSLAKSFARDENGKKLLKLFHWGSYECWKLVNTVNLKPEWTEQQKHIRECIQHRPETFHSEGGRNKEETKEFLWCKKLKSKLILNFFSERSFLFLVFL